MKRYWIGGAISVLALYLVLRSVDLRATVDVLTAATPAPLAAAVILVIGQVALVSYRWALLLPAQADGQRVPAGRTVAPVFIGYLGNFVLPARLGEPTRAYLVAKQNGLEVSASFGSVVLERLVDTATGAIVAFVLAVLLGAPPWVLNVTGIAAAAATAACLLLAIAGMEPLLRGAERLVARWEGPGLRRAMHIAERFAAGIQIQSRRPVVLVAAGLSLANWGLEGVIYWLVAQALGVPLSPVDALLVATVTVIATAVPSAPAYVGTFELAAVAVLGIFGITGSPALALAILVHVVTVLPLAVGGMVAILPIGISLAPLADSALAAERAAVEAD